MILLLVLLLAAPERVVVVAKKGEKPGLLARAERQLGRAIHRLYEKTDEDVDEGNALYAQNDAEGALHAYDRALKRLPDSPELRFDRANALLKLGSESAAEAARESAFALEHGGASLKPRAAFDLGLANEAMGKPDEAVKAYEKALSLDPSDPDAKVNLELLLRTQERKQKQQVGQPQENKQKQQGKEQQPPQSQGGEQKQDPQKQAGDQQKDQPQPSADPDQKQQQQQAGEKKQQAQAQEKPIDRSEAERLLDALRADEKNLQPWRFAREKTKERKRSDAEKDW